MMEGHFMSKYEGNFDDEFSKRIVSMLFSGEIYQYINHKNAMRFISPPTEEAVNIKHQKLLNNSYFKSSNSTDSLTLRPCNELIYTLNSSDVPRLMYDYKEMLKGNISLPFENQLDAWINRTWTYGMKAYKVCASCTEFRETYQGAGDGTLNSFDSYCSEGKYGADLNVSGLLLIPIDDDGDFIEMESNLAIWNRFLEWQATDCPSEQFPNTSFWDLTPEEFENRGLVSMGLFTGGLGLVTLLPDFIGFGEAYHIHGGPGIKEVYQTGIVPLVLKARDQFVQEVSEGKARLSNYVVSSGYSEGAMPAIVSGDALHELGFKVRTQAGGGAVDHSSTKGMFYLFGKSNIPLYNNSRKINVWCDPHLSSQI